VITLGGLAAAAAERLAAAGVEDPRADLRLLLAAALDLRPHDLTLSPERPLTAAEAARAEAVIARRQAREPVSRILGRRGFWTLDLALGPDTLDPRPDTETVVEAVLAAEPDRQRPLRIVDFGTGTGCILLALLSEYPRASGLGVDLGAGAVAVAAANAAAAGLAGRAAFHCGDWAEGLDSGSFDVAVSNPPYIAEAEMATLAPEVRDHDPRRALVAGADGMDAYRRLIPQMHRVLVAGGLAALEAGQGQAGRIGALLVQAGFAAPGNRRDLAGVERCVTARRPERGQAEKGAGGQKKAET
jgi:release factor glutamine methyltransferase